MKKIIGILRLFRQKYIKIMQSFVRFFMAIIEDLLVLGGLGIIIYIDYKIHPYFGGYSLAVVMIAIGVYIAIFRGRKHGR